MSDNVSKLHFPQPKKLLGRILLFIGIAVFVLAIVAIIVFRDRLNFDAVGRYLKYLNVTDADQTGSFSYDAHNSNRYAGLDNGLCVASASGVSVFSGSGKLLAEHQMPMNAPCIQTGKKTALCYDVGGESLCCFSENGEVYLQLESPRPILDADISRDGSCCFSTSESGYKSVLYVYHSDGSLGYRWLSASHYLPLCSVSDDAKYLAALKMTQQDGSYESRALIFDTAKEQPIAEFSLGDSLVYDLRLQEDDSLLVLDEKGVSRYRLNGSKLSEYACDDAVLKDYDDGGSGFLTLLLNMNKAGNRNTLVSVADDGTELGTLNAEEEILDFSVCGRYISVLTASGLTIYDSNLKVYAEKNETVLGSSAVQRSDGTVIVLGSDSGSVYVP